MVIIRIQGHIIINHFINLSINKQVHMNDPVVNYMISPFERKIISDDRQGDQTLSLSKKRDRQGR